MSERYRAPRFVAAATTVVLGAAGLAGCTGRSVEKNTTASPTTASPNQDKQPYPWPYCDNAPEHRVGAIGQSKEGPIVRIDSNCTDPSDPYTGVYDSLGDASQATGVPRGRIHNGSEVVVLCRREGQRIRNDEGVGSTDWDLVEPMPGQAMILPNGNEVVTTGTEMFLVPNPHLAFFDDTAIGSCPMK